MHLVVRGRKDSARLSAYCVLDSTPSALGAGPPLIPHIPERGSAYIPSVPFFHCCMKNTLELTGLK